MPTIDNVFFAYTKIMNPVTAIRKTNTEVSVNCIVSEDDGDTWAENCPNNPVKSYKNEAFKEKFKMEPPFPEQKKQYVLSVKKMISKDGVDLPEKFRPRVFQLIDGEKVDVTFEKEIGNGSRGKLAYSTYSAPTPEGNKITAQLVAILVEDLVVYERTGGDGDGEGGETPENVFGEVKGLVKAPANQKPVVKQSDAKPVKPAKAKAPVQDDEEDTGSPF